jgi:hypothetical protein
MSKYTLNFAPISLAGETTLFVGTQPFSKDALYGLRREHRSTHVFHRRGRDDVIVDIPVVAGATPIGKLEEEIDLAKANELLPPLISAAIVRSFAGARDIVSDRPVTVLGSAAKGLVQHRDLPEWIERRTALEFDTRSLYLPGGKRVVGIVCESRTRNLIDGTCADLIKLGVPIIGHYVQIQYDPDDPRILPRRSIVGRVTSIEDGMLMLDDHKDGIDCISVTEAFLESRGERFDEVVRHLLGASANAVLADAEKTAEQLRSGPSRKRQIEDALAYLRDKAKLEAVPGAQIQIGQLLGSSDPDFPVTETIPRPILVFDPSGSRKYDWSERGLKESGPYDQRTFTPKKLKIAVICQAKYEGQVDRFVAKFLDGMPDTKTGKTDVARYGDGFIRRFNLDKPTVSFFTTPTASADDYAEASRKALQQAADEGFIWDLALVQVEEEFKKYSGDSNPYYATKAILLKRDVAVQSVRLETMGQADQNLVFSMNHMSLATYAKLGGTPWLLAAKQTVAHELVIGLGSHTVTGSRIGTHKRFVGITTVFSSDGSYLLSDKTAVVPFERYADALYDTLKRAITQVRKQDNWRSTDKVRLVFHMFKPPKDTEADAIKRTVEDLGLENVTFAFVHIAPNNPYLIFDNTQAGMGYRDPKKGVLGPSRGLHIKLGDYESLVVFSGASELKQASDGMPRPCLLKLHRHSTFKDMTYLSRQAFEFSGHSWRMLAPEPFPITIRYSDLIAERLTGLGDVPNWDVEAVQFGQIGRTLWFL